jgi:hypothetical protein
MDERIQDTPPTYLMKDPDLPAWKAVAAERGMKFMPFVREAIEAHIDRVTLLDLIGKKEDT